MGCVLKLALLGALPAPSGLAPRRIRQLLSRSLSSKRSPGGLPAHLLRPGTSWRFRPARRGRPCALADVHRPHRRRAAVPAAVGDWRALPGVRYDDRGGSAGPRPGRGGVLGQSHDLRTGGARRRRRPARGVARHGCTETTGTVAGCSATVGGTAHLAARARELALPTASARNRPGLVKECRDDIPPKQRPPVRAAPPAVRAAAAAVWAAAAAAVRAA